MEWQKYGAFTRKYDLDSDPSIQKMKMNRNTIKRLGDLCVDNHFYLQQMVDEAAKIPNSDRARMCVVRWTQSPYALPYNSYRQIGGVYW